jgi:hypothetical protein
MDKLGSKREQLGEAQAIWEEKEKTEIHMTTTGSSLDRVVSIFQISYEIRPCARLAITV